MPTIDNRLPTEGTQQDILNAILQIVSTLTVDDNGHVIVNDSGTFLAQRNNLKIGGVYTEDVSGDDTTVANVIRKMTKSELLSLQGEAKKGIQVTTDEPSVLPLTTDWVEAKGGNTSTQLLDNMNNSIAPAEYGTKSVSNYSVNDVFMLNGTRMVAKSAISQGDTFVVYPATGYNCQPQTVEEKIDEITNINDIDVILNSTYFNTSSQDANTVNCKKYGRLVILTITIMTPTQNIPDEQQPLLISGLPIPANLDNYILFERVSSGSENGTMRAFRVRLSSTGELRYWYNNHPIPITSIINGQIIYISAS